MKLTRYQTIIDLLPFVFINMGIQQWENVCCVYRPREY